MIGAVQKRKLSLCALLPLLVSMGGVSQRPVHSDERTPEMTQVDGWTIVAEQDPQSLLAHVKIIVRSGSLSEPEGLAGLAHFTARGLLRGTITRPYKDLNNAIEGLGGSLSVMVDHDETVFTGIVLAENLDSFLDIVRDLFTQPAFEVNEMIRLQKILSGELSSRLQDVQYLAAQAALTRFYRGTAAAKSTGGTSKGIGKLTSGDAMSFFEKNYVKENIVVGVVSPMAQKSVSDLVASKLVTIKTGELDAPQVPQVSVSSGRHAVIVPREGMSTSPFYLAVPGISDGNEDVFALELANFVFGGDFTSRLMQILRVENGWTYGVGSGFSQLIGAGPVPGLFSIYSFPSTQYVEPTLKTVIAELEKFTAQGITEAEFTSARSALVSQYAFAASTAERRLSRKLRRFLNQRPFDSHQEYRQRLEAFTLEGVNQKVSHYVASTPMVIAVVGDPQILQPLLSKVPGIDTVEVLEIQP